MRLDKYLYEKGYVQSRNKACEMIKEGFVKVDKKIVKKCSYEVDEDSIVEVEKESVYVSRAALKLKNFLQKNSIDLKDKIALDIGASTGGFTQVLLEYGVKKVYALDVGESQLHKSLKNDKRVINLEKTDIRDFYIDKKFDIVTCDVSFISIRKILKDIDRLSKDLIIVLFKPQFEVGKDVKRDKKGVVLDKEAILKSMREFEKETEKFGWKLISKEKSSVKGKEGNEEYIYLFRKK